MSAYILLFYMWVPSLYPSAPVTAVEFSSLERCEAAGKMATEKFGGLASKLFYLCLPK